MSRSRPVSMFSTRSLHRKSRVVEEEPFDLEQLRDPEGFEWKRKYRQSLNDVDLAKQFAQYMSPDIGKSFLDHNKTEFEIVLESKPARPQSMHYRSGSGSSEESTWRDFEISARRRSSRRSTLFGTSPVSSTTIEEDEAWRELDLSALPRWNQQPIQPPPAARVVETVHHIDAPVPKSSRRQKLLRPMRSLVNFVKKPYFR